MKNKKRCVKCRKFIRLKKKDHVKKWHHLIGHYNYDGTFTYMTSYWHPWCWELEKKLPLFHEGNQWSDVDPTKVKIDLIQEAKKRYLGIIE